MLLGETLGVREVVGLVVTVVGVAAATRSTRAPSGTGRPTRSPARPPTRRRTLVTASSSPPAPTCSTLTGRLALVTGSTRGLGATFAAGLARAGARVVVHGRDEAAVDRAAADLRAAVPGADPLGVVFDVTDPAAVAAALADLVEAHGAPDVLVNNAGTQRRAPFTEVDPADWDEVLATNLSGAFHVSVPWSGHGPRGSGKVVNIGSVQSRLARPPSRRTPPPRAAGHAHPGHGRRPRRAGVQVNALSPGYVATE